MKLICNVKLMALVSAMFACDAVFACDEFSNIQLPFKAEYSKLRVEKVSNPVAGSSEGSVGYLYYADNRIKYIEVDVFGETSRTKVIYLFLDVAMKKFAVKYTRSYYSSPIYDQSSKVVMIKSRDFFICNNKPLPYIDSDFKEDSQIYKEAIEIINKFPMKKNKK